jgi:hypothetical protein
MTALRDRCFRSPFPVGEGEKQKAAGCPAAFAFTDAGYEESGRAYLLALPPCMMTCASESTCAPGTAAFKNV